MALKHMDTEEPPSSSPPPPPPPPDPQWEPPYTVTADVNNYDNLHPYSNDYADRNPYDVIMSDDISDTASRDVYVNTAFHARGKQD